MSIRQDRVVISSSTSMSMIERMGDWQFRPPRHMLWIARIATLLKHRSFQIFRVACFELSTFSSDGYFATLSCHAVWDSESS